MCVCTEKLSVRWIIRHDHKKLWKSRTFSVVVHLRWVLWMFNEWNVNLSERQLTFLGKCGLRLVYQWAFRPNWFLQSNGSSRLAEYCESCNSLLWVLDLSSCSLKWYFYFTLAHYLPLKWQTFWRLCCLLTDARPAYQKYLQISSSVKKMQECWEGDLIHLGT